MCIPMVILYFMFEGFDSVRNFSAYLQINARQVYSVQCAFYIFQVQQIKQIRACLKLLSIIISNSFLPVNWNRYVVNIDCQKRKARQLIFLLGAIITAMLNLSKQASHTSTVD